MRTPLDIMHPDLRKKVETKLSQMVEYNSCHSRCALELGDTVFAKNLVFDPRLHLGYLSKQCCVMDQDHFRSDYEMVSSDIT